MLTRKSWKEFKEAGLLWFVNMILHTFGWAIVVVQEESGEITEAYPARCKFRGFSENRNDEGYRTLTEHLKQNIDELVKETKL